MIFCGCDIGSLTAKAVLMEKENIISSAVIRVHTKPKESAETVMDLVLKDTGIYMENISFIVGTGYGKKLIPFANHIESEIVCHAKGAWWALPSVRTVVDIGGQDAKAIKIDENGNVVRFIYNDKCASGTGRFLEIMAEALEVKLDDMGELSSKATEQVRISSQCVIFAETEVISLVNEGRAIPDIINGLHRAMANRASSLAKSLEIKKDVVFTGGVAKNIGVVKALGNALGVELKPININPQISGALGAALLAKSIYESVR